MLISPAATWYVALVSRTHYHDQTNPPPPPRLAKCRFYLSAPAGVGSKNQDNVLRVGGGVEQPQRSLRFTV